MKEVKLFNGTFHHKTLKTAQMSANFLTKLNKEYYTALKGSDGLWYVTNIFDPRLSKVL